ncbi:MAG: PorV/PorQ family protein [Elusimicrobiota bacterium]
MKRAGGGLFFGLLLLLTAADASGFGRGDKGTSGAQFLKLAPGARAAAMGEAFSAVADDAFAAYYNPAGLGGLRGVELAGMRNSHFQGIGQNYGVLAVPLLSWVDTRRQRNELGVLAFSVTSLSVDGLERRGVVETDEPDGVFKARDLAYSFAYGVELGRGLCAGASVKVIDQALDSYRASAVAFDAGALARLGKLSASAGFRNLGSRVRFKAEADPLPFAAYTGAAWEPRKGFTASAEVRAPRDNAIGVGLGAELRLPLPGGLSVAGRGGFNSTGLDPGGLSGVTLGGGAEFRHLAVDFAWVPYGELGNAFRYSVRLRF